MYKIRKAINEDKEKIITYISEMIGDSNKDDISRVETEKYLNNNNYKILLPTINEEIIGICVFR